MAPCAPAPVAVNRLLAAQLLMSRRNATVQTWVTSNTDQKNHFAKRSPNRHRSTLGCEIHPEMRYPRSSQSLTRMARQGARMISERLESDVTGPERCGLLEQAYNRV